MSRPFTGGTKAEKEPHEHSSKIVIADPTPRRKRSVRKWELEPGCLEQQVHSWLQNSGQYLRSFADFPKPQNMSGNGEPRNHSLPINCLFFQFITSLYVFSIEPQTNLSFVFVFSQSKIAKNYTTLFQIRLAHKICNENLEFIAEASILSFLSFFFFPIIQCGAATQISTPVLLGRTFSPLFYGRVCDQISMAGPSVSGSTDQ